jgi:probable HAF family extracellular repeat protein
MATDTVTEAIMNGARTRSRRRARLAGGAAVIALAAAGQLADASPAAADPPARQVIDLGTFGGRTNMARDLNDRGQVVGNSEYASGLSRAYLWERGTLRDIGPGGSDTTFAVAINDRGQAVGVIRPGADTSRGFLWSGGRAVLLPTLGGVRSDVRAINEHGQVAGTATDATGETHAVLWDDGRVRDLGLGAVYAMNDRGQVVVGNGGGTFLWDRGRMTDLAAGLPEVPGRSIGVTDLNDRGTIVGVIEVPGVSLTPFRWQRGTVTQLAEPSAFQCSGLLVVNDRDQIAAGLPPQCHATLLGGDRPPVDLGASFGSVVAINERGEVAGSGGAAGTRAQLWTGGRILDLGLGTVPGAVFSTAVALNDHGEVVAFGGTPGGSNAIRHSFLSVPGRARG